VLKGTELLKNRKVISLTWSLKKMLINRGYDIVPEAAAECSEGAEADVGANNPSFFGKGGVTLVRSSLPVGRSWVVGVRHTGGSRSQVGGFRLTQGSPLTRSEGKTVEPLVRGKRRTK
jgi:hypothetical protein